MRSLEQFLSILNYRGYLKFIPDKVWIKYKYKQVYHRSLNLDCPETFNEKLQWLKLNYKNPVCIDMVDKIKAKEYVSNKIGREYIIPTLGVWNSYNDIEWRHLPDQFVLKCNHDSGGLVICRDKNSLDVKSVKRKIVKCLNTNYFWHGREWVYKQIEPKIFAEIYMEDKNCRQLTDYKFYCFNGEVKCLYVSTGLEDHKTARMGFFDLDFRPLPFKRLDYLPYSIQPEKPKRFEEMLNIAEKLSKGFPFLRVDLYEINDKVYFSELTFFPSSGWMLIDPEEWDYIIGSWLELPS